LNKNFQFILNKPQLSENIGMSIRSIGCFGFDKLDLVNPRNVWPNEKGLNSSKHFGLIAKKVRTFSSIPKAIEKSDLVIATTVRPREIDIPYIKFKDLAKMKSKNISIIFGQENNGLNNHEISHANFILTLPTIKHRSLNLSHAVSIVAFELSQLNFQNEKKNKIDYISSKQIEKFIGFLMKTLKNKGFTTISSKSSSLEISIRNYLKKSKTDQKMLKTAYGIIKFITK
tara:strand:- start:155 stop:841 length:687 start_codon:yes stop_codon:yes gene_type:complete